MDVTVRNKKTGEQKVVPEKVYEALKHVYTKIDDGGESVDEDFKKKENQSLNAQPVVVKFYNPVVVNDGIVNEIQTSTDPEINEAISEYEKLTGKKPDGRWSKDKLARKITEHKLSKG